MRRLDRSRVAPPPCLEDFRQGRDNWSQVTAENRQEIRTHLERLQGRRCAYCEGSLDELGQHIEHFRSRSRYPQSTFYWSNLYWSCNMDDSCGRYKDQSAGAYDVQELVDPCRDDPDRFFRFRSDGTVGLAPRLSTAETRRAQETLRVFNLDPQYGRLRRMRQQAVQAYLGSSPGILETLQECIDEAERRAYIQIELEQTANDPFGAVVRHLFLDMAES